MGERSESNRQPEAYEAPALPLSYAPEFVHGRDARATFKAASWDRTSNLPLTRRLLCPLSYHGVCLQCSERDSNPPLQFGRLALCRLSYHCDKKRRLNPPLQNFKCVGRGLNPRPPRWQRGVLPI